MRWLPLASALLLLTGCFGDDSGRDPSAEFVKQVNAICRESDTRFAALGKPPGPRTAAYRQYVRNAEAVASDVSAKFRRLDAPRDLEPVLRQWRNEIDVLSRRTAAFQRASAKVEADAGTGARADAHFDAYSKTYAAMSASQKRLRRLTRRAGMTDCYETARSSP